MSQPHISQSRPESSNESEIDNPILVQEKKPTLELSRSSNFPSTAPRIGQRNGKGINDVQGYTSLDISSKLNGKIKSSSEGDISSTPTGNRKLTRLSLKFNNTNQGLLNLEDSPIIKESNSSSSDTDANGPYGVIQRGGEKIFVEPKLAEPKPVYTGLPLESCPSSKIKKESLWASKGGTRKSSRIGSRESSVPPIQSEDETIIESAYKRNLKTDISEKLTSNSEVREPLKIKLRGRNKSKPIPKNIAKTPIQTKNKATEEISPLRTSKRIKVISPKKASSTYLAPSSINDKDSLADVSDDSTKDNEDFCSSCGGPGIFICCESCPKSFHFTCCDPPFEDIPDENWHCRECNALEYSTLLPSWNEVGIFGQLLNQQERRNPKEFQLPKFLRDNTFIGVSTGENGEYKDVTLKPELSFSKVNGAQIAGFNKNEDLEIDNLYDKKGRPYLCHKCGLSGLNHKTLVHCDYCPLVYHIDCLDQPLCAPKTIGSKWRCPNHLEELLPVGMFNKRQFKDSTVLDVALHNQFLKIASMNNIVIKYDNQPYCKDGKYPSLHDYLQYQSEDFARFDTDFIDNSVDESNENEHDKHSNFKIPNFFQNYSTTNGITAKSSSKLSKIITMTSSNGDKPQSFVYRIPEKSILLDFISKANHEASVRKSDILNYVEDYENTSRLETNEDERVIVDGLIKFKSSKYPTLNFEELVNGATKYSIRANNSKIEEETSDRVSEDEISDLLRIKKLMEIKGRDALLNFLQS